LLTGSRPYRVFRCDRSVRHGNGVSLFVRDNFKLKTQQVQLPSKFDCLEIIVVDFSDSSVDLPYRIVVANRAPNYSPGYNDLFFSALDYLANGFGCLCVLDDLNLPDFDWELFLHSDSLLHNAAADLVCNNFDSHKKATTAGTICWLPDCHFRVVCTDRFLYREVMVLYNPKGTERKKR
jgi:hypothetical protein